MTGIVDKGGFVVKAEEYEMVTGPPALITLESHYKIVESSNARVRLETAKEIEGRINLFFDEEIEKIYAVIYGDDSDEPMMFDDIKRELQEFLSVKPQSDNKKVKE